MLRNYYYLVAGLPDLLFDQESRDFNVNSLKQEVKENVHPSDYKLVELLYLPYDNHNFLNALLGRGLEPSSLGSIDSSIFANLDDNVNLLPEYMQKFYYDYTGKKSLSEESEEEDVSEENFGEEKLVEVKFEEMFFDIALKSSNRFIKSWFTFTRDFNNFLAALSCRKLNLDPAKHLVGKYPLVEAISRSQSADFGLKSEVDYLDKLLQAAELDDMLERERRLDIIKWEMASELTTWDYFNINFILAFFIKAGIVSRWRKLDTKIGEEMFKRLFDDLKSTYNLSASFASQ